jgi:ATP-dependent protease ClpP protease subunit
MAAVILQGCAIRRAFEHSEILIHNVRVRKDLGKLLKGNLEKELEESIKTQESIIEILAWRTKQSVDLIRQRCDEEKSMSPEEARTFGLIDEVICFKPINEYQNAVLVS